MLSRVSRGVFSGYDASRRGGEGKERSWIEDIMPQGQKGVSIKKKSEASLRGIKSLGDGEQAGDG